jgi:hypothetical protein
MLKTQFVCPACEDIEQEIEIIQAKGVLLICYCTNRWRRKYVRVQ